MKDSKVELDGVKRNELNMLQKAKVILVISSIILVPLTIVAILLSKLSITNKVIFMLIGVLYFSSAKIEGNKN